MIILGTTQRLIMKILRKKGLILATTIFLLICLNPYQKAWTTESKQSTLTGSWTLEADVFHANEKEGSGCLPGSGSGGSLPEYPEFKVDQEGANLRVEGNFGSWASNKGSSGFGSAQTGRISGNQVTLTATAGSFTFEYNGTVNEKGDKVTGTITCKHPSGSSTATGNFTWTREKETVFHYFYINGLNTAAGIPGLEKEGTCEGERIMVQRLLNELKEPGKLEEPTCNPSGREPDVVLNLAYFISKTVEPRTPDVASFVNCFRRGNLGGLPFALGDLTESAQQAIKGIGTKSFTDHPLVLQIFNNIKAIMDKQKEAKDNKEHYFIIIAHSQGNFFAESVAKRLESMPDPSNPKNKLLSRLGVLAIASPTNYADVPQLNVKGFTRADDGILLLNLLSRYSILPNPINPQNLRAKEPMPANLPPLNEEARIRQLPSIIPIELYPQLFVIGAANNFVQCAKNAPLNGDPTQPDKYTLVAHLLPNYLGYHGVNFPTSGSPSKPFTPLVFKDILVGLESLKRILGSIIKDRIPNEYIRDNPEPPLPSQIQEPIEQPKSEPILPQNPNRLPDEFMRDSKSQPSSVPPYPQDPGPNQIREDFR
jgi:hypothetical protein